MDENNYGILLYGPRYIGTTSFVRALPDCFVLDIGSFWRIKIWENFKSWIEIHTDQPDATFKNIAIDKVSTLYGLCVEYICEQQNVDNIYELGANKWELVEKEMTSVLYDFARLPGIKWYLAPSQVKELNTSLFTGNLIHPELDWTLNKIMPHITQRTIYMGVEQFKREFDDEGAESLIRIKARRILVCSADSGIVSGDSLGIFPKRVPIAGTAEEAVTKYLKYSKGLKDE